MSAELLLKISQMLEVAGALSIPRVLRSALGALVLDSLLEPHADSITNMQTEEMSRRIIVDLMKYVIACVAKPQVLSKPICLLDYGSKRAVAAINGGLR